MPGLLFLRRSGHTCVDKGAEYAEIIEIDLSEIKEPILCCPNDPDDAKLLRKLRMGEYSQDAEKINVAQIA